MGRARGLKADHLRSCKRKCLRYRMPWCHPAGMRVTYGNLKGGVAKSTSSVYTALGLAAAGGRVLLVDADATNRTCLKWSSLAEDWPAR